MHKYFFPIILAAGLAWGQANYTSGNQINVVAGGPGQNPILFVSTYTGEGVAAHPLGEWSTVDVSHLVPPDTKAIFVNVIMGVNHGAKPDLCNLYMWLRNYGERAEWTETQVGEVASFGAYNGMRDHYSDWVPITDGKFEIKWDKRYVPPELYNTEWPDGVCSVFVYLKMTAYIR